MPHSTPKFIEPKEYNRIINLMPIACVDIFITHGNKFLLGKRVNDPGKNQWYPIGGRVIKGELLKKAAARKIKEELNILIKPKELQLFTAVESIFKGKTTDQGRHSVNIVFLLDLKCIPDFNFDKKQILELHWFSKEQKKIHSYVKTLIRSIIKK